MSFSTIHFDNSSSYPSEPSKAWQEEQEIMARQNALQAGQHTFQVDLAPQASESLAYNASPQEQAYASPLNYGHGTSAGAQGLHEVGSVLLHNSSSYYPEQQQQTYEQVEQSPHPTTSSVLRRRRSPTARQNVHPYAATRPQSASGGGHNVRFPAPYYASGTSSVPLSPLQTRSISLGSASSPLATTNPINASTNMDPPPLPVQPPSRPAPRYSIRADIYFDKQTHHIIASLELPGMRKSDVRLTLSTCPWNRVKQLVIAGSSRHTSPNGASSVTRERKYGFFTRMITVPSEITIADVEAEMSDGILVVKVACAPPTPAADPQEITIR